MFHLTPLQLLEYNAAEIAAAVQDKKVETLEERLVPDQSGERIYKIGSGPAAVLVNLFSTLAAKKKEESFTQAIAKTTDCFDKVLRETEKLLKKQRQMLEKNESSYDKWKKNTDQLLLRHRAVQPLHDISFSRTTGKIKTLADAYLDSTNQESMQELENGAYLARMILAMRRTPAVAMLRELGKGRKVQELGKEEATWAQEFHKVTEKEFLRVVFRSFLYLGKVFSPDDPFLFVGHLHQFLQKDQHCLFDQKDTIQIGVIDYNKVEHYRKQEGILEDLLVEKPDFVVFSLKKGGMAILYRSTFQTVHAWNVFKESPGFGFPSITPKAVHPEGLWIETEFSGTCLDAMEWDTESLHKPGSEQNRMALALANVMRFFVEKRISPKKLSPSHLWFGKKGIRTLVPIEPSPFFDLLQLEQFCWEVSKGNTDVFRFIMNVAELNRHPHSKPFITLVSRFDPADDFSKQLAVPLGMQKVKCMESARQLWDDCSKLAEDLKHPLKSNQNTPMTPEKMSDHSTHVDKKVLKMVRERYNEGGGVARILPQPPKKKIVWETYHKQLQDYENTKTE